MILIIFLFFVGRRVTMEWGWSFSKYVMRLLIVPGAILGAFLLFGATVLTCKYIVERSTDPPGRTVRDTFNALIAAGHEREARAFAAYVLRHRPAEKADSAWMPRVDPRLIVYDGDARRGGYCRAVEVAGRENPQR